MLIWLSILEGKNLQIRSTLHSNIDPLKRMTLALNSVKTALFLINSQAT